MTSTEKAAEKEKIIFIGGGKLAGMLHWIFKKDFDFIGYIDDVHEKAYIEKNFGIKKLGSSKDLPRIISLCRNAVISIGSEGDTSVRWKYFEKLLKLGFNFPPLIASTAVVAENVSIGSGSIIQHNAIIAPKTKIGKNCIISTNAFISHDNVIGNNVFIGPGSIINGSSIIGDNTFIGTGSTIIQKKKIGKNCLVGAAS